MKTLEQSTPNLHLIDRAIINNNNYTITTNNDYIVNSCTPERDKSLMKEALPCSGIASLSIADGSANSHSEGFVGTLQNLFQEPSIPANWEYIKLDLYNNATLEELAKNKNKFKLAINIKKSGQSGWVTLMAGLNSEIRFMKRGLDTAAWESGHYWNVRESYAELKGQFGFARASKTYLKGYTTKGQTVEDMSVVLAPNSVEGEYYINLHFQEQQWLWLLKGGANYLTPAQRKKNIIATAGIKRGSKVTNLKAGDLL